jgi:hypothetical protein
MHRTRTLSPELELEPEPFGSNFELQFEFGAFLFVDEEKVFLFNNLTSLTYRLNQ